VDKQVFSYKVDGQLGYLINPEIVQFSETIESMEEGCLSVPGLWKTVSRSASVTISGTQLDGEIVEIEAEGLLAQTQTGLTNRRSQSPAPRNLPAPFLV
jgi:peptide deformylase